MQKHTYKFAPGGYTGCEIGNTGSRQGRGEINGTSHLETRKKSGCSSYTQRGGEGGSTSNACGSSNVKRPTYAFP